MTNIMAIATVVTVHTIMIDIHDKKEESKMVEALAAVVLMTAVGQQRSIMSMMSPVREIACQNFF